MRLDDRTRKMPRKLSSIHNARKAMHSWMSSIPVIATLVLAGLFYLRAWLRSRTLPQDKMPVWRAIAFLSGLLSIWLAVGSPLAMLDQELLTAHMVQHILLMTVSAPLILLGSPVLNRFLQFARSPNLVLCWFAAAAVLIGWHIPAGFDLGRSSIAWHHLEFATFLVAGLLFWWPVIPSTLNASHPRWSLVLYLFLATLPCDALSAFLAFCGRVVYSSYLNVPPHFNLSPLEDQQCAGALMWTCATFAYLIPAVIMTMRLLSFPVYETTIAAADPQAGAASPKSA